MKGTTTGVITSSNGSYSISNIPENAILQFSFVGMRTQEIAVGLKTSINVTLTEETIGIEEVVAIGYGTMKKSDLTGSIAQVKGEILNSIPSTNVLQAISGRTAGVQVLQNTGAPGANVSVRIRGANSIMGSNEPLYVIDGFPTSSVNAINNSDIESMEILKDASAIAIYGSRGANGVVLITTKRGKEGKTNVDIDYSYSSQTLRKKMDLMNGKEWAMFYNEQAANDHLTPYFTQNQINNFGTGFDWQDLVFQTAPMQTLTLRVSGGNEKTQFSISGSTLDQDGIVNGSGYQRYALLVNINHNISKKFSVNLSNTLTKINVDNKNSGGGDRGNSMIASAIAAPPVLTPYNADGTYTKLANAYPFVATDLVNPLNFINELSDKNKANKVLTNLYVLYKPMPELTIKILGGIENEDSRNDYYQSTHYINSTGYASVSASQYTSLLNENTISYNKTFNKKHNVSAVAGFTYQDFLYTSLGGSGTGFLSDVSETYDLKGANKAGLPTTSYTKSNILSYLGRINYSFNEKYFATVSFRADGSSKYSEGEKWGYFPSVALAWRISNEDFLKDNSFISNLKLRASWGVTGSQAISAYATLKQLYSGKTIFGDTQYTTFGPSTTLPGNLKWETTAQTNIGFDLGILKDRISLSADYYIKNTK